MLVIVCRANREAQFKRLKDCNMLYALSDFHVVPQL